MQYRLSRRNLFFAICLGVLSLPQFLIAQQLRFNYPYACNKERIVVVRCRKESDMPGYPTTRPEEDYCHVEYPDRPLRGGLTPFEASLRSDVIKQLQSCGAFATPAAGTSGQRSGADESVAVFKVGDRYYKEGNYEKALEYFKESNKIAVSSAATIMTGISQYQLKMFPEAIVSLKETIRMAPDNPEVHYWLGMAYKDLGIAKKDSKQYDLAVPEFREAIRLRPDYHVAHTWLGAVLFIQHKYADAAAMLQQALRLKPDDSTAKYLLGFAYVRLGQKANAMQVYREMSANSDPKLVADLLAEINKPAAAKTVPPPPGTAEYFLAEGNRHRDAKEYTRAIEQYRKAIALKPDLTGAQLNLGFAYYQLEDFQSALPPFKKAATLDPKDDDNQFWLGVTYYKLEQYASALTTLKEAIRLDPKSPYSHYNLGETYLYGMKDYAKAEREYLEAIRLKPDYDLAYNQLGLAYLWQDKFADALQRFQTAFELKGASPEGSPTYLQNIGLAQASLGNKAEAMNIYRTLQKSDAVKARELLAFINDPKPFSAPRSEKAATDRVGGPAAKTSDPKSQPKGTETKKALPPGVTQAEFDKLVQQVANWRVKHEKQQKDLATYYDAKQFTKVVSLCDEILKEDPKNEYAHMYLGMTFYSLGDWQRAVNSWDKYFLYSTPLTEDSLNWLMYGDSKKHLKQFPDALKAFENAQKLLEPDDLIGSMLQIKVGETHYEMGQFANAVAPFNEAIRLKPDDPVAHYDLGLTYAALGKESEARREYSLLLKLDKSIAAKLEKAILARFLNSRRN